MLRKQFLSTFIYMQQRSLIIININIELTVACPISIASSNTINIDK